MEKSRQPCWSNTFFISARFFLILCVLYKVYMLLLAVRSTIHIPAPSILKRVISWKDISLCIFCFTETGIFVRDLVSFTTFPLQEFNERNWALIATRELLSRVIAYLAILRNLFFFQEMFWSSAPPPCSCYPQWDDLIKIIKFNKLN